MKRTELNIQTGEAVEITVLAYKNAVGNLLLLDEGEKPPKGYTAISDEEAAQLNGPSAGQVVAAYIAHIQKRLDDFARTRGYDGVLSCCTYATSTVAKFKAEGQYMVDARDQTWSAAYRIFGEVEAGVRPVPALDALDAELPDLSWPA